MATIKDRYQLEIDTKGATSSLTSFKTSLGGLGPLIAGAFAVDKIVDFGKALIGAAGQFENYNNKLKLISGSQAQAAATLQILRDAAVSNRAAFGDTVDLYSKLALATESLGISQDRLVKVTGNFQKALAISGADAGTAAGAIRQFGQAMASGQVRGDEFNSIVEALGPALNIMARESGITVGKLREMSQAGELNAEVFFKMIEGSNALGAAFDSTNKTISQSKQEFNDAADALLNYIAVQSGAADAAKDFFESGARVMRYLSDSQTSLEKATTEQLAYNDALGSTTARLDELNKRSVVRGSNGIPTSQTLTEAITEFRELNKTLEEGGELTFRQGNKLRVFPQILNETARELGITIEELIRFYDALSEGAAKEKELAEEAKRLTEILQAQVAETKKVTDSISQYNTELAAYAKIDVRSAIEKATDAQAKSLQIIDALFTAQRTLNLSTESGRKAFDDIAKNIENAKTAYFEYGRQIDEIIDKQNTLSTLDTFYEGLVKGAEESVRATTNAGLSIAKLNDDLANNRITLDTYAEAMDRVNGMLGINAGKTDDAAKSLKTYKDFYKELQETIANTVNEQKFSAEALADLKLKFDNNTISIEQFIAGLEALGITLTQAGYSTLAYEEYLKELKTTVEETLATDGFKAQALIDLKEQFDAGSISIEQYNGYMKALGQETKSATASQKDLTDAVKEFQDSANNRLQGAQDSATLSRLTGIRRDLKAIELEERRVAEASKKRIAEQFPGSVNSQAQIEAMAAIDSAMETSIAKRQELLQSTYDEQRSFATGMRQAFEDYADAAGDSAAKARSLFEKSTKGMEDAIVGFAKTGKFEWKSFVASIAEEILRNNIRNLIAQTFSGARVSSGSGGGGLFGGSIIPGLLANGGPAAQNKPYIIGERGPELFIPNTAGRVVPTDELGGVGGVSQTSVTYNINAVDAASFRALVSRDPGFIHAVAQAGARTVPGRRK
jgi:lambda family phage tail tape measure protein